MGIEGLRMQRSWERFFAGLSADREKALQETAQEITAAMVERFRFRESMREVRAAVQQAISGLHKIDTGFRAPREDLTPEEACLGVFRKRWFETAHPREYAQRVGFFSTEPCDVLPWVRWFLLVEHYHRTDPGVHDRRLDRLRFLKTENPHAPCITHEDVLLWTEHQLLVHDKEPLHVIARSCAQQLQNRLDATLKPDIPLEAFCYLLLRCHQFCLAETMAAEDAQRLQTVLGWRRFLSLTDLMLVVIQRVIDREPLPDAVSILEGLIADGFHIRHASFKDPYEVDLVPPQETARFEEAAIRLFTPISELTGVLEKDCETVFRDWNRRRKKVLEELLGEIHELRDMVAQPLPRKHVLGRSARLFTSWCLASWKSRGPDEGPGALIERVRAAFPEGVLKALVRQRRGYEVATRKEFMSLIERECRLQWDSFWKEPGSRAFGEADFRVAVRTQALVSGPAPPENGGVHPEEVQQMLSALGEHVSRLKDAAETSDAASCLGSPIFFPTMGTPLEFIETLRDQMPLREIFESAPSLRRVPAEEAADIYERTLTRYVRSFYRFVLAGHKRAQGDLLDLSVHEIPDLAAVIVPPWGVVAEGLARSAVRNFRDRAAPIFRRQKNPLCVDAEECGVHLAHFVVRELHTDVIQAAEAGTLESLRKALGDEASRIVAPRHVKMAAPVERFLLQWAGIVDGDLGGEVLVRRLVSWLPGLDCGACGESRCAAFALSLTQGRRRPGECVHLTPADRTQLEEALRGQNTEAPGGNVFRSPYHLFQNPALWRRLPKGHPLRHTVIRALDVGRQEVRRRVMEKALESWRKLEPKPSLCRRPDPEAFYQALVDTIGYEATERIRPDERRWLSRHGILRLEKELERLKNRADWLTLERRRVSSGPSGQDADPEVQAERAYASIPYLHLLHEEDRRRLLVHRLESFEEGFSQWWNQDLLAMNHPKYRIDNWEEFSKVIKNAYWHQENFPPPRRVAEEILEEMEHRGEKEVFFRDVLASWVQSLGGTLQPLEGRRVSAGETARQEIQDISGLKAFLIQLCRETARAMERGKAFTSASGRVRRVDAVWEAFQSSGVSLAPGFTLSKDLGGDYAAIRGLIQELLEHQDHLACLAALVEDAVPTGRAENIPAEAVRAWISHALDKGEDPPRVLEKILGWFHRHPQWKDRLLVDALQKMVSLARWRTLVESFPGVVLEGIPQEDLDWYATTFPGWMERVEAAVRRKGDFDRERLLHYLFVLAKREGDLDVITGLLREIRETSDIIEAAWLQFTNDRLTEALPVPMARGLGPRYSLLLNRMKDLESVRRCLVEGLSRGEKPDVAAAVRELQLYMRFQVVRDDAEYMDADACFEAFWEEGYHLEGLDKEDLRRAFLREWENRARWRQDRVWIMTMAVARRLASQSHELYEADRAFSKIRQGLLKEDGLDEGRDVVQRRGIALGTLKEAMYRELSELLEKERMDSFRTRIRQIVHQLDRKRLRIVQAWFSGTVDRYSVFHVLRQYQKGMDPPSDDDFRDFFMEQWFQRIDRLRESDREDREERIREVDEGFHGVFGVSPLGLEKDAEAEATREWNAWLQASEQAIHGLLGTWEA